MYEHGTHSRYANKKYLCRCDKCKVAATEYQRQRRLKRPDVVEKNRIYVLERKKKLREYIQSLKKKPCVDCGVEYPYYVMQFDHLEGYTKEVGLARVPSKAKIDKEVLKCEVVCANCHAERTHKRKIA